MTVFIVIAIASLAGVVFFLTFLHYRDSQAAPEGGLKPPFRIGEYLRWLGNRIKGFFSSSFLERNLSFWKSWTEERYPGWIKWVFIAFAAAFLYLGASGLFFAVFFRRGMFGFPLLAHVMGGGLFALGLAAVLMLRSRFYGYSGDAYSIEALAQPKLKRIPKPTVVKALFWVFASLGFVQVVTSLCSMLPAFTFNTQVDLIMIHRYSALGLVLTAIVFFDVAVLDRPKTSRA
jgi:hypothetical protein